MFYILRLLSKSMRNVHSSLAKQIAYILRANEKSYKNTNLAIILNGLSFW